MDPKDKIILIADDEPDILEIISYNLTKEGYTVYTAKDGNDALEKARLVNPDLFILDIMMPYKNGIEVCRALRSQPRFKESPIILLTALSDEGSHIKGLDSGADDFITKPVSPKILLSRVSALFRRTQTEENNIITAGNITIDATKYTVAVNGVTIILAKKEFELLHLLATKPGRVFLRNEILEQIWGNDVIVGDRTIDVHIRKIRQKLGVNCISTIKGVGYKFEYEPEPSLSKA
ncbi:response regulator transcription factor [Parafilimonas terrae]|uniref:Phosphate regulon transcriptional regulatory protein PhoB n=1 Tax=Parafilimonas terrae TaxID=1465490 RepID=A0A1I5UYR7_9BACT|nr:response regulator transcription factor [Parafilimonas terrae]SFQ00381.1 two-component system, OmpR family, alkaline phosphatase synthesis response regulator PhoP [Parafilimonas terrae]